VVAEYFVLSFIEQQPTNTRFAIPRVIAHHEWSGDTSMQHSVSVVDYFRQKEKAFSYSYMGERTTSCSTMFFHNGKQLCTLAQEYSEDLRIRGGVLPFRFSSIDDYHTRAPALLEEVTQHKGVLKDIPFHLEQYEKYADQLLRGIWTEDYFAAVVAFSNLVLLFPVGEEEQQRLDTALLSGSAKAAEKILFPQGRTKKVF
jgi:hypothetical protein